MANIKITELNEILKKDNADVLPIVDVSANETKKIAIEDLLDKNIALIAVTDTEPAECSTGDKYYNTTTKKIYTAINTDVWDEDGEDPISGILYIVYNEQASYSWDGTDLVSVGGGKEDIVIDNTQPTDPDVKLWIDTGEIGSQVSEITNEYSTSTGLGYSANFTNGDVLFETDSQNPLGIEDNITLNASIDNYRMIEIQYNRYGYLGYVKAPTNIRLSTTPNDILVNCDLSLFANGILRIYTTTYVLSGTSMSRSSYTYWNTNQGVPTGNAENQLTVTKVIGYK